jgi:uncharacterized protein YqhQ
MFTVKQKLPLYGGQALMEGVMMRGSRVVAAAFRLPDGTIKIQSENLTGIYKSGIKKIPFLRGLVTLWDSLVLGMRYLTLSANYQSKESEKMEGASLYTTVLISIVIAVAIFILAPAALGTWLGHSLMWTALGINLVEGGLRFVFIVGYMALIRLMPDIKRVFMYHGAEHKTINGFESGADLTPAGLKEVSRYHPRCGTSFLLTFVVLSIIVFALFGQLPFWLVMVSRILVLPIIAALAYEWIRLLSNHMDNPVFRALSAPNMALQGLTTAEPTPEMLEVALAAFTEMLEKEKEQPA